MKLGLATLVVALLSTSAVYATPVTLTFTASGYEVPIASTGTSGSMFTVQPGSCATPDTTCTWAGNYTSSNPGFPSVSFTITTTLGSAGERLTGVQDTGNPDTLDITGAPSDVNTTITLIDATTGSHEFFFITNGVIDGSLAITGFETDNSSLFCDPGYCTVSEINNTGRSFEGEPFANFTFDDGNTVSNVPEPSSLALLGTGALGFATTLRRRLTRAA